MEEDRNIIINAVDFDICFQILEKFTYMIAESSFDPCLIECGIYLKLDCAHVQIDKGYICICQPNAVQQLEEQ